MVRETTDPGLRVLRHPHERRRGGDSLKHWAIVISLAVGAMSLAGSAYKMLTWPQTLQTKQDAELQHKELEARIKEQMTSDKSAVITAIEKLGEKIPEPRRRR